MKVTTHLYDDTLVTYRDLTRARQQKDWNTLFELAERLEAQARASDSIVAIARGEDPRPGNPSPEAVARLTTMACRRHDKRLQRCAAALADDHLDDST